MTVSVMPTCMHVCHMCTGVYEIRRVYQISWNWNYGQYEVPCECWEAYQDLLKRELNVLYHCAITLSSVMF